MFDFRFSVDSSLNLTYYSLSDKLSADHSDCMFKYDSFVVYRLLKFSLWAMAFLYFHTSGRYSMPECNSLLCSLFQKSAVAISMC